MIRIAVIGLQSVVRALRSFGKELARALDREQGKLADFILDKTVARGTSQGGALGKAARSGAYTGEGDQRAIDFRINGDEFEYALGGEFGAIQYKQFKPWRGNQFTDPLAQNVGYALFPVLREEKEHILRAYDNLIDDALFAIVHY
jgi:hypothetical protein